MTRSSIADEVLEQLYLLGECRRSDMDLFIRTRRNRTTSYRTLEKLISRGYIRVRNISSEEISQLGPIIALTQSAKRMALASFDEEIEDRELQFSSSAKGRLAKMLRESTMLNLFSLAGVPSFACEKPSLLSLYRVMNGSASHAEQGYLDAESFKDAMEWLEGGVFYTAREYREFFRNVRGGASDTFDGSRFAGIYITDTRAVAVYAREDGRTKIIRTSRKDEESLVASFRILDGMSSYLKGPYQGGPECLVVMPNMTLLPKMCVHSETAMQKTRSKESVRKHWFIRASASGNPYGRIVVVDTTEEGVLELKSFLNGIEPSRTGKGRWMFPYMDASCIVKATSEHIPAESGRCFEAAVSRARTGIIASAISREDLVLYNLDGVEAQRDEYFIYDSSGIPKGRKKLKDILESNGVDIDERRFLQLPKEFGYASQESFYNAVAKGEVNPYEAVDRLKEDKTGSSSKESKNSVADAKMSYKEAVKLAARIEGVSASEFTRRTVYPAAMKIIEESRRVLYENRSYFREISNKNSAKKALKEK